MRVFGRGLGLLVVAALVAIGTPTQGQTGEEEPSTQKAQASGIPLNKQLDPDPDAPSPLVTQAPPEADFLVIPLRVHVLRSTELPAVDCKLTNKDVERVIGKVNAVWHKAGVHWALGPILREPAARPREFKAARAAESDRPLAVYKLLFPDDSRAADGVNLYYAHDFPINGAYFTDRTAIIRDSARVRPIPGGIDEALARVTAHELGHALGLQHRKDEANLLASGTSGVALNQTEVNRVRARAPQLPGVLSVADLRRQLDEARGQKDAATAARLDATLKALASPPPRRR